MVKHIVLFGAGKSATVLIDFLKQISLEKKWRITIADNDYETVYSKVGEHPFTKAVQINIENGGERKSLIQQSDIVISLMPAALHYLIALDCIEFKKNLLTASYIDEQIHKLKDEIKNKNLLFLYEMGLDPGIDHMSAMQLIHRIKNNGGVITSFKSHCGGLVAPESDDNPWHYKISWNPHNIILAGKDGAVYKEHNETKRKSYTELFENCNSVKIPGLKDLSNYPNRDSLSYIPVYALEKAETFIRTTLRHPDFCFGWKNIIDLKLTDEKKVYDTNGMTIATFFKKHFDKYGFSDWLNKLLSSRLNYAKETMDKLLQMMEAEEKAINEGEIHGKDFLMVDERGELNTLNVEDIKDKAAESVAEKMHEANLSMKQLFFLGLDDETPINKGLCSAADILQFILEKKLALQPHDKDMIVMLHEIEYVANNKSSSVKSYLIVKGKDSLHTAMAQTVGLPLGIAAKLILEEKITDTGLHIPTIPSIYEPVLESLKEHGIVFKEIVSS